MGKIGFSIRLAACLVMLSAVWGLAQAATEIRSAHFPPVPEGWNIKIDGQTVIYTAPKRGESQRPSSILRFTHTKNTAGQDAQGFMESYISNNNCSKEKKLGKGFYTVSCRRKATDAVVVGEENNLYLLEITGEYSKVAVSLLNTYLNEIVKGKHTFEDRDIGEKVYTGAKPAQKQQETDADGSFDENEIQEDPF